MDLFWKLVYRFGKRIGLSWMIVGILFALFGISGHVVTVIIGLGIAWLGWQLHKVASKQIEEPSRLATGFLGAFVSGYILLSIVFGVAIIFGIIAFFQYKP